MCVHASAKDCRFADKLLTNHSRRGFQKAAGGGPSAVGDVQALSNSLFIYILMIKEQPHGCFVRRWKHTAVGRDSGRSIFSTVPRNAQHACFTESANRSLEQTSHIHASCGPFAAAPFTCLFRGGRAGRKRVRVLGHMMEAHERTCLCRCFGGPGGPSCQR